MKLRDQVCVILAIIMLLLLIFHKMEQDNQARLNTIATEQQALVDAIEKNEIIILSITRDLATANEKLTEWEDIDVRWLKWIEENWHLVKKGGDKMEKKPCAKCACLSSDVKHKAFGMRGFVVICPCCEHRVDGSTKKEAVRNWNGEFRMGER